ncbi:MAG: aldolase/citrate lyase family protein [Devosia sp.]
MHPAPPNRLKRLLAEGKPALGCWLSLNSTIATEIAAGSGFDWVLLDMEHSLYGIEAVERHLLAARHGGEAEFAIRVPSVDPVLIKRLLDAGARSFMFPFVQTVEEARLAVAATRYPPAGIRGVAGGTRAGRFGTNKDYLAKAADEIVVIVQIESQQAAANIPASGAIDGVDALLIGANDLAATMGLLGQVDHPEVKAAFDAAFRAIRATGKAAGFQFFDLEYARKLISDGFTLAAVGGDVNMMLRGSAEVIGALR